MENKSGEVTQSESKISFSLESILKRLTNSFNIILGISSCVYTLGFLMWLLYAWDQGLGYLPALREQNLVAGIVPMLIVVATYYLLLIARNIVSTIFGFLESLSRYKFIRYLLYSMLAFVVIDLAFIKWHTGFAMLGMLVCGFLLSVITGSKELNKGTAQLTTGYIKVAAVFCSLILLLGYLAKVFPNMPQDIAGPKPRLVQLDVYKKDLSGQTQKELFSPEQLKDSQDVLRTKNFYLLFECNDFVLLKKNLSRRDTTSTLCKLNKGHIKGIYEPNIP